MKFTTLLIKHTIFLAVLCCLKIGINILNESAACDCSLYLENRDSKFLQNICLGVEGREGSVDLKESTDRLMTSSPHIDFVDEVISCLQYIRF